MQITNFYSHNKKKWYTVSENEKTGAFRISKGYSCLKEIKDKQKRKGIKAENRPKKEKTNEVYFDFKKTQSLIKKFVKLPEEQQKEKLFSLRKKVLEHPNAYGLDDIERVRKKKIKKTESLTAEYKIILVANKEITGSNKHGIKLFFQKNAGKDFIKSLSLIDTPIFKYELQIKKGLSVRGALLKHTITDYRSLNTVFENSFRHWFDSQDKIDEIQILRKDKKLKIIIAPFHEKL